MRQSFSFLIFILLFAISSCDKETTDPLQGSWESIVPNRPEWVYSFDRGVMTQTTAFGGSVLSVKQYPYAERGDTLVIGGDATDAPRRWLITFTGSDVIEIVHLDGALATPKFLKRK